VGSLSLTVNCFLAQEAGLSSQAQYPTVCVEESLEREGKRDCQFETHGQRD